MPRTSSSEKSLVGKKLPMQLAISSSEKSLVGKKLHMQLAMSSSEKSLIEKNYLRSRLFEVVKNHQSAKSYLQISRVSSTEISLIGKKLPM